MDYFNIDFRVTKLFRVSTKWERSWDRNPPK